MSFRFVYELIFFFLIRSTGWRCWVTQAEWEKIPKMQFQEEDRDAVEYAVRKVFIIYRRYFT